MVEARGRVERHRHAAGEQRAVEAEEVLLRGGQHDRHRLPRRKSGGGEPRRVGDRSFPQRAVRDLGFFFFLVENHREPVGLAFHVVLQRLGEGLGALRRAHPFGLRQARHRAVRHMRGLSAAREQKAQQVARRLARGEGLLRQAQGKLALEAQHELHSRQAVQPELALERAVERDVGVDVRPRFARDLRDYGEDSVGIDTLRHGGGECTLALNRGSQKGESK